MIFKDESLLSIRDLDGSHVDLLSKASKIANEILERELDIDSDQVYSYFHYLPTFWKLHLHVVSLDHPDKGGAIGRNKTLEEILINLELKSDYYQTMDLFVSCPEKYMKYFESQSTC